MEFLVAFVILVGFISLDRSRDKTPTIHRLPTHTVQTPDITRPMNFYGDLYPKRLIGVPVPVGALKSTLGNYAVGSVDACAPFPSVTTQFEKVGILTSFRGKNTILNLFMRPIAPNQNLWEYQVQDKNGFIIKLDQTRYLEDGDEIKNIIGKHDMGPWRVHMFAQNKYVWV